MAKANCKGLDLRDFYPEKGQSHNIDEVKKVCFNCEVQAECLEYAIDDHHGIWGGTTENDRRNLRRRRQRVAKKTVAA